MISKEDLLEAIGNKLAKEATQEELLEVYSFRQQGILYKKSLKELLFFAAIVKVIKRLNCGIEDHLVDCVCTPRYSEELIDDIQRTS